MLMLAWTLAIVLCRIRFFNDSQSAEHFAHFVSHMPAQELQGP